jgi:hypothetical protein
MKLRVKEKAGYICTAQRTSIIILRTLLYAFDYLASNLVSSDGLSPLGMSATIGLLYQLRMIDERGAVGGMRIGRGNRSTRRKRAPVPLYPPQIPHDVICTRTRAAAVGSRQLTALAMERN